MMKNFIRYIIIYTLIGTSPLFSTNIYNPNLPNETFYMLIRQDAAQFLKKFARTNPQRMFHYATQPRNDGFMPYEIAIQHQSLNTAQLLQKYVNKRDNNNNTPLHNAIITWFQNPLAPDTEISCLLTHIAHLIRGGASLLKVNNDNKTPLDLILQSYYILPLTDIIAQNAIPYEAEEKILHNCKPKLQEMTFTLLNAIFTRFPEDPHTYTSIISNILTFITNHQFAYTAQQCEDIGRILLDMYYTYDIIPFNFTMPAKTEEWMTRKALLNTERSLILSYAVSPRSRYNILNLAIQTRAFNIAHEILDHSTREKNKERVSPDTNYDDHPLYTLVRSAQRHTFSSQHEDLVRTLFIKILQYIPHSERHNIEHAEQIPLSRMIAHRMSKPYATTFLKLLLSSNIYNVHTASSIKDAHLLTSPLRDVFVLKNPYGARYVNNSAIDLLSAYRDSGHIRYDSFITDYANPNTVTIHQPNSSDIDEVEQSTQFHLIPLKHGYKELARHGLSLIKNPSMIPQFKTGIQAHNTTAKHTIIDAALGKEHIDIPYPSHDSMRDSDNMTPVMWAMCQGHETVAHHLLNQKVTNIHQHDNDGKTLSTFAAKHNNVTCWQTLLKQGAQLTNYDNADHTPLSYAARNGHKHIISAAFKHPATHQQRNGVFLTALHQAASYGQIVTTGQLTVYLYTDRTYLW